MAEIIVPDTEENASKCRCPGCPTHNECMKSNKEQIFCSRGNTNCKVEKHDCLCGTCPITPEYGLIDYYYCVQGAAKK